VTNLSEDREQMEGERDFLLHSLDDLDAELLAGNVDPDTYRMLHDDYTARAAAVVRSLDDGVPRAAPGPKRLRAVTAAGIVLFCVLLAFLLARAVGERRPGQTATGNDAVASPVTLDPNSYEAHIRVARALLEQQDLPRAIEEYTAAAAADPGQPEPLAYRGWISALVADRVADTRTRATLTDRATKDLDKAIALDPKYLDAYFFKGYMLYEFEHRPAEAVAPLQWFLALAPPDHPLRPRVLAVLDDAQTAARPKP
jgi:tetratricopeptide (TPR) repeat protein